MEVIDNQGIAVNSKFCKTIELQKGLIRMSDFVQGLLLADQNLIMDIMYSS